MSRVSRSLIYENKDTRLKLEVIRDAEGGIGPSLSMSLSTRGFAGEDGIVPFEEHSVGSFLAQLAQLDLATEGEACLRSAAYTAAGEGTQLRCSTFAQGGLLVQMEMRRILQVGKSVEVLGLRGAFELEGAEGLRLLQDLQRLLSA